MMVIAVIVAVLAIGGFVFSLCVGAAKLEEEHQKEEDRLLEEREKDDR